MTALFVRERMGIGQKVEVSLLGTQIALQSPDILHFLHFGEERAREFRASPTVGIPPTPWATERFESLGVVRFGGSTVG